MIRNLLLAVLLLPWLACPGWAVPREVEVTATGATRAEAITNGLVQALEQVRGVAIASNSVARTEMATNVKGDDPGAQLTGEYQSATAKLTGGFISSYRVLSATGGSPTEVVLTVAVEVFEPKGLGNETRRRIAIMPFAMAGGAGRTSPAAAELRDRIVGHLVLGRRFAVVDRAQDAAYAAEMHMIQQDAMPMQERTRLGQVIAADYVVTGKISQTTATSNSRTIGLTGEVVTTGTAGSEEASYQVIEVATRQVKFAGAARVSGSGTDVIAQRIADEITQALYPMRLIRFNNPARLIIGQGGDALRPGQRFRAMLLGEALTDPYTKESLGQAEEEIGIVEIRQVDQKTSYGKLVSGHLPAQSDNVQIVLRPTVRALVVPVRARRPTAVAPSITKLPFDP